MDTENNSQLVVIAEVGKMLGVSISVIERRIRTGKFPPCCGVGRGKGSPRQWLRDDVIAYAARVK